MSIQVFLESEEGENVMQLDGYSDCLVGVVTRFGQPPVLCYDICKVIAKLMSMGMTEEGAWEWFDQNIIGAWVGDTTPAFIDMNP